MRKLASVRRILDIQPIEGADKIVRAQIDGWWVVTAITNGFKVGDLVCYMEVDSFVPSEVAPFLTKPGQFPKEFNGVKGERLRTIRLRGCLSQGLIIPLDGLNVAYRVEDGMDLTEILKIQQWEAPIAACLAGQAEGSFPGWIRKTDQERCQNLKREIQESFDRGDKFEVTVKLDGSSGTYYFRDGEVGVCSRNLRLKVNEENKDNTFIRILYQTGLNKALPALGMNIAVQGEILGPNIQHNRESLPNFQMFVFDVFNIDTGAYLSPPLRKYVLNQLRSHGFIGEEVPVLHDAFQLTSGSIDDLLEMSKGPSLNAKMREGIVLKRIDGQFSFKAINNDWLLRNE